MPKTPAKRKPGRKPGTTSEAIRASAATARAARKKRIPIEGHKEMKLSIYGPPDSAAIVWFRGHGSRGMVALIEWLYCEHQNRPNLQNEFGNVGLRPGGGTGG